MESFEDVGRGSRLLIKMKNAEKTPMTARQRGVFNLSNLARDPCACFYVLRCQRGIGLEFAGNGNLKVTLLTNVYFAIAP